jgi:hypothetical protein
MKLEDKDKHQYTQSDNRKELAQELRYTFDTVSPFIEKHTSIVCPECEKVCCIDKHGHYDSNDIVFLRALGTEIIYKPPDRKETDPCRFLTDTGCSLERWARPYRCTYFFCDPVLKSLENDNAKLYRAFVEYFQHLVYIRQRLLE